MIGRRDGVEALFESIISIQAILLDKKIRSAVIGGIAVGVWGEPRVTRDIDLKVLLGRDDASQLLHVIGSDYTAMQPNPLAALARTGILFVRDRIGTRIDLLLSDTVFDRKTVERAVSVNVEPDAGVIICSPEDLVIYKLISTRLRDHEDAAGVIRRQKGKLDERYIIDWLGQFEAALDDSTLIDEFNSIKGRK
jgi:hypothetical protein